jgi:hypothetical protein
MSLSAAIFLSLFPSCILAIHFRNHARNATLLIDPLSIDTIQCGHHHSARRIYWPSLVDVKLKKGEKVIGSGTGGELFACMNVIPPFIAVHVTVMWAQPLASIVMPETV